MSIRFGFILTCLFWLLCPSALSLDDGQRAVVVGLVHAFREGNREEIASLVEYPLRREYPVPPVKDRSEMIARFDEVFAPELISRIVNSDIDRDWKAVGARGIMLGNGEVWLDAGGQITAVNYQSQKERQKRDRLIGGQRERLHSSLADFERPVLEWKTPKYRIRIDSLGDNNYRYAAWSKGKGINEKPDIVIANGERVFEGSGGNHHYIFRRGDYEYRCDVIVLGPRDSPPGILSVIKNGKVLLEEPVVEVLSE